MTVGILAFQGDFAEHRDVLQELGVRSKEIRSIEDLGHCTHLIIPGGESTVMSHFLQESGLMKEIPTRVKEGTLAIYGTCAGAILLAKKVRGKNIPYTLKLMDIDVDRNAYGTQLDSFERKIQIKGSKKPMTVSFIRAPMITRTGKGVIVLAHDSKQPVLVQQGRLLAGTFHPEMRGESGIHKLFLNL